MKLDRIARRGPGTFAETMWKMEVGGGEVGISVGHSVSSNWLYKGEGSRTRARAVRPYTTPPEMTAIIYSAIQPSLLECRADGSQTYPSNPSAAARGPSSARSHSHTCTHFLHHTSRSWMVQEHRDHSLTTGMRVQLDLKIPGSPRRSAPWIQGMRSWMRASMSGLLDPGGRGWHSV